MSLYISDNEIRHLAERVVQLEQTVEYMVELLANDDCISFKEDWQALREKLLEVDDAES